jgi:hypothetical protein
VEVHLFQGELHTAFSGEKRTRRAIRAGGLTLSLRPHRRDLYPTYTMTSNNTDWENGWFYLCNDGDGIPPYTGKVLKERSALWSHDISLESRRARVAPLTAVLK